MTRATWLPALFLTLTCSLWAQDPDLPCDVVSPRHAAAEATRAAEAAEPANPAPLERVLALHDLLSEQSFLWLSVPHDWRERRAKLIHDLAQVQSTWLSELNPTTLAPKTLQRLFAAHDLAQRLLKEFADGVPQGFRKGKLPQAGLEAHLREAEERRAQVTTCQPGEPEMRLERVRLLGEFYDQLLPVLEFTRSMPKRHALLVAELHDVLTLQLVELDLVAGFQLGANAAKIAQRASTLRERVLIKLGTLTR